MATAREIRKRIRSVNNIGQITRALEAVSASRVRKAQARVLASRAYSSKALEILLNVQSTFQQGVPPHPLLTNREEVNRILVVLLTSERGLAGAYNTNMIRVAQRFEARVGKPVDFITVGRKGRDTMIRTGANVVAEFEMPAEPTIADIAPISRLAIEMFLSGQVDDVYIAYTDFINTLTQRPMMLGWLPFTPHKIDNQVISEENIKETPEVTTEGLDYEYEPNPVAILDEIVPAFSELILYQAVLEAQASEHSARMVAMRNASDNAKQLASDLTLVYNKARQAGITAEILDIVGGAEALQASIDKLADEILNGAGQKSQAVAQPVASAPAPAPKPSGRRKTDGDDLTRIEGIGPKMSAALIAAGIDTFAKLATADTDTLRNAIEAAGMSFSPSLETWAEQAKFAAEGNWDGLKAFQETLVSGRRPS